jgi:hypothetical protein
MRNDSAICEVAPQMHPSHELLQPCEELYQRIAQMGELSDLFASAREYALTSPRYALL